MTVFWDIAPWNLVETDQRGVYCLHHQGDDRLHGAISQKTAIFKSEKLVSEPEIDVESSRTEALVLITTPHLYAQGR
jgi:hypothetical protein